MCRSKLIGVGRTCLVFKTYDPSHHSYPLGTQTIVTTDREDGSEGGVFAAIAFGE